MTAAADLLITNAEVQTLTKQGLATDGQPDANAIAIRDGQVVRVGDTYDLQFLADVETETIDLDGRTVLPGFVDAHTHLVHAGERAVHADLSVVGSAQAALDKLAAQADTRDEEWIVGVGYDESTWDDGTLTRDRLDTVSDQRPVVAIRVDVHTAACNTRALEIVREQTSDQFIRTADGEPTGIVVEEATELLRETIAPGKAGTRRLIEAGIERATSRGITTIHDKVRNSPAPRIYRDLAAAGELDLRVRIDYWSDHVAAIEELGLRSNHGGEFVTVGGIKTFTDGAIGGRTAKVSTPYRDTESRGQWVVAPAAFHELADRVGNAGLQFVVHAIGDEAIDMAVETLAEMPGTRHRIEHLEMASDETIEQLAETEIIASMQPNFHRWARADGLYETALGSERTAKTNRLGTLHDAGVMMAFGSDGMPMDPLYGIEQAVTAPTDEQTLDVGAALRAYTYGGAYAGFQEDVLGTIEPGKYADLVVLEESPWTAPEQASEIDVSLTIVGGEVVYDDR